MRIYYVCTPVIFTKKTPRKIRGVLIVLCLQRAYVFKYYVALRSGRNEERNVGLSGGAHKLGIASRVKVRGHIDTAHRHRERRAGL